MNAPESEEAPDQAAQYIASLTQELAEIARRNGLDTLSQARGRSAHKTLVKR
jgi:glutamate synthase domain-containing protein 2